MNPIPGEVWFVKFPLEENPDRFLNRPAIVLSIEPLEVLSVKVTKTAPRPGDQYDTPIVYWQNANLKFQSTARISKTQWISIQQFIHKIGKLHTEDWANIQQVFMRWSEP